MKKLLFVAMLLIVSNVQAFAQNVAKLDNGEPVQIRLITGINSQSKVVAQPSVIVEKDVKDANGNVLIKRGTPVQIGYEVEKARGIGNGGFIKLNFLSTTAVDGQDITLQGAYSVVGDDRKGLALGLGIGTGLTVLFPVGFFFLCLKGESVNIPEQTLIPNVVVNDNYKIQLSE